MFPRYKFPRYIQGTYIEGLLYNVMKLLDRFLCKLTKQKPLNFLSNYHRHFHSHPNSINISKASESLNELHFSIEFSLEVLKMCKHKTSNGIEEKSQFNAHEKQRLKINQRIPEIYHNNSRLITQKDCSRCC